MFDDEPSETQGENSHMNEDENKLAAVVESNISIFIFLRKHFYLCSKKHFVNFVV